MADFTSIPEFEYISTLADSDQLSVRTARLPDSDELFLVNRVSHSEETKELFRALYSYASRKSEQSDLLALYNVDRDFYAVFRCVEAPSLAELYSDGSGSTARRLNALINALLRLSGGARGLPAAVVCCALQPQNILVDDEGDTQLRYQFLPKFLDPEAPCDLWNETGRLLSFMLAPELENGGHRQLKGISKKCRAGLYGSLPELISDLKKALDSLPPPARASSPSRCSRTTKAILMGGAALVLLLLVLLIVKLTHNKPLDTVSVSDIGNIQYVIPESQRDNNLVLSDASPLPQEEPELRPNGTLTEDSPLDSVDYIVQPGDTLDSICLEKYGSESYAPLVAAFNGLKSWESPEPGNILRLPEQSQLSGFFRN